jgi:hypothetical protein
MVILFINAHFLKKVFNIYYSFISCLCLFDFKFIYFSYSSWNTRLFGYYSLDDSGFNFSGSEGEQQQLPKARSSSSETAGAIVAESNSNNTQSITSSSTSSPNSNDSRTPIHHAGGGGGTAKTSSAANSHQQTSLNLTGAKYPEYKEKHFFSWMINLYKLK